MGFKFETIESISTILKRENEELKKQLEESIIETAKHRKTNTENDK